MAASRPRNRLLWILAGLAALPSLFPTASAHLVDDRCDPDGPRVWPLEWIHHPLDGTATCDIYHLDLDECQHIINNIGYTSSCAS